jgi:hypothetical protein
MESYTINKDLLKKCKEKGFCVCEAFKAEDNSNVCPCETFLQKGECKCPVFVKIKE